jgi:hypothetical protein
MDEPCFINHCFEDSGVNLYRQIIGDNPKEPNFKYPYRLQYFLILLEDELKNVYETPPIKRYGDNGGSEDEFIFFSAIRHLCYICMTNLHYLYEEIHCTRSLFRVWLPDFSSKIMLLANETSYLQILRSYQEKLCSMKHNTNYTFKDANTAMIQKLAVENSEDGDFPVIEEINFKELRHMHAHRYQLWWWHQKGEKGFLKEDLNSLLTGNEVTSKEFISKLFQDVKGYEASFQDTRKEFISGGKIVEEWHKKLMQQFKTILGSLHNCLPAAATFAERFEIKMNRGEK